MKIFNLLTTKFGNLSPAKQVLLLVGTGALLANAMAAAFFLAGGYERLDTTIYVTTINVVTVGTPYGIFLVSWIHRLKRMAHELDTAFRKDGMTGLSTRHEFYLRVEHLIKTSNPAFSAGAILYIDVDHFKAINDKHGHALGDELLQELGVLIRDMLGSRNLGARFGGEEFILFLPDADYGQAAWMANRILTDARKVSRRIDDQEISVTVSIGVSFHHPGQALEQVVNAADECLYQAKNQGRNCIVYAPSEP